MRVVACGSPPFSVAGGTPALIFDAHGRSIWPEINDTLNILFAKREQTVRMVKALNKLAGTPATEVPESSPSTADDTQRDYGDETPEPPRYA
jgi:hypothetical protein